MSVLARLQKFLDDNGVEYTHTVHRQAYSAREVAAVEHLPAREFAKTLVFLAEGAFHMIVVPASRIVDIQDLRTLPGFAQARLATEQELGLLFPDCELGAMPPFGNLYKMPVYMDAGLNADERIAFNAGTHRDVLHIRLEDFKRLAKPEVLAVAREFAMRSAW